MKTKNQTLPMSLILLFSSCSFTPSKTTKAPPPAEVARLSYGVGSKALEERDAKKAIKYLATCLQFDPKNSQCQFDLGWAFFMDYEFGKAKVVWEDLQKFQPKKAGLKSAIQKVNTHLKIQTKSFALRKEQPQKFDAGRLPAASEDVISIRAVGDLMLGTNYPTSKLPPGNKSPLEYIESELKDADITFANYEGTICDSKEVSKKCDAKTQDCFAFRTPTKYAPHLKDAGIDVVSLANNHILDFGEACRTETEKTLDSQGISWSGRPGTVARFEKNNIKFSMIAFHSASHSNSTLQLKKAKKMIEAEKKDGRIVIVSFHGGAEGVGALNTPKESEIYMKENRGDVINFAHKMIDAGADLLLGSGPHVVRGMEIYKDRLIAYSLGNFSTYKAMSLWGLNSAGAILEAKLDKDGRFVKGQVIPTRQLQFGYPIVDKRMTSVDVIRMLSKEDFPQTGIGLAQDGSILLGPTRAISSEK
jgi:poly-gamma-glutamate capsule biosynthesis protein CapA/YwtB (metallophosphatase superfamily)